MRVARLPALLCSALAACTASPDASGGADAAADAAVLIDSGIPPAGDACRSSDLDGDGFGTDPSCPLIDCDDHNLSIHPGAPEACNRLDEDCDGTADNDLGSGFCGSGACRREVPNCLDGQVPACTPGQGTPETCNGLDDDCDGMIDQGVTGPSCGSGACQATAACVGGVLQPCTPGQPGVESCNRLDDNCDGTVDEGFRVQVVNGSYAALYGLHPGCDGAGERMGPSCNAAMHRYCASQGCSTTGFGPLENSGDLAIIACLSAGPGEAVPYATLATHHPPCDGTNQRIGPDCNAAIHRYCQAQGHVSGYGPVEQSPTDALVVCLDAPVATNLPALYSVLVTIHDGCNTTTRIGPACNAAINRYCAQNGYRTGFGPVENSGDNLSIVCVRD